MIKGFVRSAAACFLLAFALLALPAGGSAQTVTGVGFQPIRIRDPVNGGTMPGYVFYPSTQPSKITRIGPYELHAVRDAPAISGPKPLVLISHGHGGSDLGHHDLAVYLAGHGFIAATLEHPKDNFRDASGDGHPEVEIGRPIQVKATISTLLDDARWKTLIDPQRIGVAGFSNGGYTALLLVGAVPRFTRFLEYCAAHPSDPNMCGNLGAFKAEAARRGQTPEQMLATMQSEFHRWGDPHDSRVKAAFAMAPMSLVFDNAGLASIHRPVFLYYAQDDQVLKPKYNVLHVAPLMKTLVGIRMIPKAGHYVFLSPCSLQLTREAPGICNDPPGVDRAAVHRQIDADALAFFRRTLKVR
jgi:predicted dienelactone hydrolase